MGRKHKHNILSEAKRRYNEKQKEAKTIIEKSKVLDHLMTSMRITLILIMLMVVLTPVLVYIRKYQSINRNYQTITKTHLVPINTNSSMTPVINTSDSHAGIKIENHTQPPLSSAYKSILGSENVITNTESYPHQHEVQGLINGVKGAIKDLHSIRSVNEFY